MNSAKKLTDVMGVGDYIKFNGVHIQGSTEENMRNIKHMTTAMVVAKTAEELKYMDIPTTAARIQSLDQVTNNKIENFKIVTRVMNNTKITDTEAGILGTLESGEVAKLFGVKPKSKKKSDTKAASDDSDDEITVIGDETEEDKKDKAIIEELKPSELRKLMMCYMEAVTKNNEYKVKMKMNLEEIRRASKTEKSCEFLENFFLYLGRQCKSAIRGVKFGHVFVNQSQVNLIKERGILSKEDIKKVEHVEKGKEPVDTSIGNLFTSQDLRKILLNFMKVIQSAMTLQQLAEESKISEEEARELIKDITQVCKATIETGNTTQGIKYHNVFINSAWVDKINKFDF